MTSIFISTLINTGIIIIFTNADLQYSILSWIPLHAQYSDFNSDWYLEIATAIVKTMVIMAMFPYAEFVMFGGMKVLMRMLDSGFYFFRTEDHEMRTKKKTQRQYINLYAGPEYLMHFKYSSILV